jgi:hypothetical protein
LLSLPDTWEGGGKTRTTLHGVSELIQIWVVWIQPLYFSVQDGLIADHDIEVLLRVIPD